MNFFNNPNLLRSQTQAISRFLQYVTYDTTSDAQNSTSPSSFGQSILGKHLVAELQELGIVDAQMDSNGYVTASLPGHCDSTIGLIAHLDTSDAFCGQNVHPQIHENYQLQDLILKNDIRLSPNNDVRLKECQGHTIITSDGTTLLGADDKAGIAIIMGVVEYLTKNPQLQHPNIKICFTPDEEIGRGASLFPLESFDADFAITVDGTSVGQLNIETFEAYSVDVSFEGISIHPGYAKGKMVNALRALGTFLTRLPQLESPEHTENREGFIHPIEISGDAAFCRVHLIVRDFSNDDALKRCEAIKQIVSGICKEEPRLKAETNIQFSYPNMYKFIQPHEELVTNLKIAVSKAGITPSIIPIRGGTDGANLSNKGLVTPNVFTGAVNLHGPKEWVSIKNMGYSFCTILNLMSLYNIEALPEN